MLTARFLSVRFILCWYAVSGDTDSFLKKDILLSSGLVKPEIYPCLRRVFYNILVIILAKVRNKVFAHYMTERILQLD